MSAVFSKNLFLAATLTILIAAAFGLWTSSRQPPLPTTQPPLPTFGGSVADSVNEGVARYGAEGFSKKSDQELRDALAKFQAYGPKVPGMPVAK